MISQVDIRKSMRITHAFMDDEIQRNIDAARLDMSRVGIEITEENNALINKLIELYCKAQFDYLGKGEQFQKNYESLRDSVSLAGDYKCEVK